MQSKYSIFFTSLTLTFSCCFANADQDLASAKFQEELNQKDPFSLVKSYKTLKNYDEAIQELKNYIQNTSEKQKIWYAQFMIGECYQEMNFWDHALQWYLRAYETLPNRAEPLQKIASYYRINGKTHLAYLFAKQGSSIPYPKTEELFVSVPVYDYQLDEEMSIAAYYTPFKEDGFAAANRLMLKKNVPSHIKEQTHKNMLFYVQNLATSGMQPIEIELPLIREGAVDYFAPMNPTIQKTSDGYDLICRTVNFSQKEGKEYKSRDEKDDTIRTRNFFVRYDSELKLLSQKEIIEDLPREKVSWTKVVGLEDCRLINLDHNRWFLATTYDTHAGTIGQSLCKLASQSSDKLIDVETLLPIQGPHPTGVEKNWLPFVKDNELYILYGYDPFIIYKLNKNNGACETVVQYNPSYDFSRFRGSAAPIEFDDGYLVLIHEVVFESGRYYLHRFLYLDKNFNVKKVSKPFTFMHKGIEYSCGMTLDHSGKTCIIPIGYEDQKAYLLFVDLNTIRALLEPLP